MNSDQTKIWSNAQPRQLAEVLAAIDDVSVMQNFLRDVLTLKEITEVSARLEAARMLADGQRYVDITAATKLSSRTVARISEWLQKGCSGYETALNLINAHHAHIPPACAE